MKIIVNIIILVLLSFNFCYAVKLTGAGSAVISAGNVKGADKAARDNAIMNAIASYFEDSGRDNVPEVSREFFKFIRHYRILERYVQQYTVFYKVEVDYDETSNSDLSNQIKNHLTSAVFYVKLPKQLSSISKNFEDLVSSNMEKSKFSLRNQGLFSADIAGKSNFDEIASSFSKNKSKYLFVIEVEAVPQVGDIKSISKISTLTKIYSKNDSYPYVKAESSVSGQQVPQGVISAFEKCLTTSIEYITANITVSKKETVQQEQKSFDLVFSNYHKFNDVQSMIESLKNKSFISSVKIKSLASNRAEFEVVTRLTIDDLADKLSSLNDKNGFKVDKNDPTIFVDFNK